MNNFGEQYQLSTIHRISKVSKQHKALPRVLLTNKSKINTIPRLSIKSILCLWLTHHIHNHKQFLVMLSKFSYRVNICPYVHFFMFNVRLRSMLLLLQAQNFALQQAAGNKNFENINNFSPQHIMQQGK